MGNFIPRKAKRDASEAGIIKALRAAGFSVYQQDQPCDLLVGRRGENHLIEVKSGNKGYGKKLNRNQQKFNDGWRGGKMVKISSVDEAIKWANEV